MVYTNFCMECGSRMTSLSKCSVCGADYYSANDIQPPKQVIESPYTPQSNTYSNNASVKEIDYSKFISASELESMISAQVKTPVSENL